MDFETNNPDQGTGYTEAEATERLSSILDLGDETTDVDVEEVDDAQTEVTADEEFSEEQTPVDSEDNESDAEPSESENEDTAETPVLSDDTIIRIGDQDLTLAEVRNGYLRTQDYTRKTQALAAERQVVNEQSAQARHLMQTEVLQNIGVALMADLGLNQPNWNELKESDPIGYADKREEWDARQAKIQQILAFEKQLQAANEAQAKENFHAAQVKARDEFTARYSEFAKPEVAQPLFQEMSKMLADEGFSHKEIQEVCDSRMLSIVYQAFKYKNGEAKAAKAKERIQSVPTVAPAKPKGAGKSPYGGNGRINRPLSYEEAVSVLSRNI